MNSIIGRNRELDAIGVLRQAVDGGRTQILLLTGEQGSGRATLGLRALAGQNLVRFHHRRTEGQVPLSAIRQVLEVVAAQELPSTNPLEIASLMAQRMESSRRGYGVLMENIDLMDQASKEVIWHVAQRMDDIGLMLVYTSSDPHCWLTERLASHLAVGDAGTHLHLGPLAPNSVREYLRRRLNLPLTTLQLDKVMAATGGSPMYLAALLEQLENSRLSTDNLNAAIEALSTRQVEDDWTRALHATLAELNDDQVTAMLAIALAGSLSAAQLERVCDALSLGPVVPGDLRQSGLLVADSVLAFRRQDYAEGVIRSHPSSRRQEVHRALGGVLPGMEGLRHRVAAPRGDDGLMDDLVIALLGAVDVRDMDTAHRLASWMAELDANMLPTACLMTFRAKRPALLAEHADDIRAMMPGLMRQLLLASLEVVTSGREPAELTDPRLLESDDETVLLLLAHTYSELARLHAAAATFMPARMLVAVRQSVDRYIAEKELPPHRSTEFRTLSAALRLWGVLGEHGHMPRRAVAELENLAAELRDVPDVEEVALRSVQVAAAVSSYLSSNAAAVKLVDDLMDRLPGASHDLPVTAIRFRLNFLGGRWDEAQLANEPALAHALDTLGEIDTLRAHALSAIIPLCRGEEEIGRRILARVARHETGAFNADTGTGDWARGWVAAINDEPQIVVDSFDPMWLTQTAAVFAGVSSGLLRVRAHAELGDEAAARGALGALRDLPLDEEADRYYTLHAEAVLCHLVGDAESADQKFRDARVALDRLIAGTPLGWLLFRVFLAEDHEKLLAQHHELVRPGDGEVLDEAILLTLQLGAKPWRARLEKVLADYRQATGESAPEEDPSDPTDLAALDILTSREREITLLVLKGLGNREIAQQLFLSVRTVEFHVRNALQKLGVPSRIQLREKLGVLAS